MASASPENRLEMQILRPTVHLLNHRLWGRDTASPPGDSDRYLESENHRLQQSEQRAELPEMSCRAR